MCLAGMSTRSFWRHGTLTPNFLRKLSQPALYPSHGERARAVGIAVAGKVENPMQKIREELVLKAELMSLTKRGGHGGADNNLAVRECKHIGGGWIAQKTKMEPGAFGGPDKD